MAIMRGWAADAGLLVGLPRQCEVGLHLTLTDETPLSAMPCYAPGQAMPSARALFRHSLFRKLPTSEIEVEVARQFAAFSDRVGRPPDFVDAHQHVHHLPHLREIVLEETARHAPAAWVRSCSDAPAALLTRPFPGKAIGSAWHSRGYAHLAACFGIATNRSFAGHYDFSPCFASVFQRFFDSASDHHVIMTHPGAADRVDDPIARARVREASFLEAHKPLTVIARNEPFPEGTMSKV
jgi:hypothetical protein